jgi:hypothetical protein
VSQLFHGWPTLLLCLSRFAWASENNHHADSIQVRGIRGIHLTGAIARELE